MEILLNPQSERWLREKMMREDLKTESEAIEAVLAEAQEREKFRRLRSEIDKGLADEMEGRVVDGKAVFERILGQNSRLRNEFM